MVRSMRATRLIVALLCWLGLLEGSALAALQDGLFISNTTDILFSSNVDNGNANTKSVYHNDDSRIVGLAVDTEDELVFWSDISFQLRGIYKGMMSGSGQLTGVERIVEDIGEVNGISVDYVRNYIYWTDCKRSSIEVAKYDGSSRVVLTIDGLMSPRGIYADPVSDYLYWNSQGNGTIERARLDGSGREKLVSSNIHWPNQMVVKEGKIYYVDGYNLDVVRFNTDGTNRKVIGRTGPYGATHDGNNPFGLAIDEHYVYVSIWYEGKVVKLPLNEANEASVVFSNLAVTAPTFSLAYSLAENQGTISQDACSGSSCGGICLPSGGSNKRCACASFGGQTLQNDGTCTEPTNLLFYVLADEGIVAYKDLDGSETPDRYIVGRSLRPVAVAYDPVNQYVYWSDVHERTVHKAKLDGTDHTIFMSSSSHSIGVVDGLALDYVHQKLYYSNMGTIDVHQETHSWHKIEFIGLDGSGRKTVVDNVDRPRGLYLDIPNEHLYYTDWGKQARVARVDLDGSNHKVIRSGDLDNPNSVTKIGDKLYIVDSHYKTRDETNPNYPVPDMDGVVYSCDTDGSNWEIVENLNLKTPFGLTQYNGKLYISDWTEKAILSATPGGAATEVISDVGSPMNVLYSKRTMTAGNDVCSSASCSEVCVVSSGSSQCTCDTYNANVYSSAACSVPSNFIITADFNSIKLLSLDGSTGPGEERPAPQVVVEGSGYFSNFVAMAYDSGSQGLYYTDVNRKAIYYAKLDGSENRLLYEADKVIDGMDLSGDGKLYWTAFEAGAIYSTDVNSNETVSIRDGLSRPRAIKVHDVYIYFTEWGQTPRVSRMNLQGSALVELVGESKGILRPNGLDVDATYLYIGDSLDEQKFVRCNKDGSDCKEMTMIGERPKHIYSIHVHGNALYYTDWEARTLSLVRFDKTEFENGRVIHLAENLMRPTEIILEPTVVGSCPNGHGCHSSDHCHVIQGGYFCTCDEGMILGSDKKTCEASADEYVTCDADTCSGCSDKQVCAQRHGAAGCQCVCKEGYTGDGCNACPANQYKSKKGSSGCTPCPAGSSSSSDFTMCECNSGVWNWQTEMCDNSGTKPGNCPNLSPSNYGCTGSCTGDSDCSGAQKCCAYGGCSANQCVDPKLDDRTECVYGGEVYQVAESFDPMVCVNCQCMRDKQTGNPFFGFAHCDRQDCPALDCEEDDQEVKPGACCPVCTRDCDQEPITIVECENGRYDLELTLDPGDNYVDHIFSFNGRDNCDEYRTVKISYPQEEKFAWHSTPYKLTATATAAGEDYVYRCNIYLTVKDATAPQITCPVIATQVVSEPREICVSTPTFSDNVCGTTDFENCILEGNVCRTLSVGTHQFDFTVKDHAENTARCTVDVTVEQSNSPCTIPAVLNGQLDCSSSPCQVLCNSGYDTTLLDETEFTCNDGSYSPPFTEAERTRACTQRHPLSIYYVSTVEDMPCPLYPPSIIIDGLMTKITRDYIQSDLNPLTDIKVDCVVRHTAGCGYDGQNRRKRADDEFAIQVELSANYDASRDTEVKDGMQTIMNRVVNDIKNGVLINWQTVDNTSNTPVVTEKAERVGCGQGQIEKNDVCINCPAGTKKSDNSDVCELCPLNEYNERESSTYCKICPDGKITEERGTATVEKCVPEPVKTTEPDGGVDGGTDMTIIIIIVVVVVVVLIAAIIIAIVVIRRRKGSSGDKEKGKDTNFANPAFDNKEEEVYEEPPIPDPNFNSQYQSLSQQQKEKPKDNHYAGLGEVRNENEAENGNGYMHPVSKPAPEN